MRTSKSATAKKRSTKLPLISSMRGYRARVLVVVVALVVLVGGYLAAKATHAAVCPEPLVYCPYQANPKLGIVSCPTCPIVTPSPTATVCPNTCSPAPTVVVSPPICVTVCRVPSPSSIPKPSVSPVPTPICIDCKSPHPTATPTNSPPVCRSVCHYSPPTRPPDNSGNTPTAAHRSWISNFAQSIAHFFGHFHF